MTRRYTGRRFARYSSVPLSNAPSVISGCTASPAWPASDTQAQQQEHQRHQADGQPEPDAARLEAELHFVVASRHGDDSEQDIAAEYGRGLAVHTGHPARVVGVAEDQPRVGRRPGANRHAVRGIPGHAGLAATAAIRRPDAGLGPGVVGQDHLLVGVKRPVHHLAQRGAQAWRYAGTWDEKGAWKGLGVLEHADLAVGVDLVVLGLGLAEELVGPAAGPTARAAEQGKFAAGGDGAQDRVEAATGRGKTR